VNTSKRYLQIAREYASKLRKRSSAIRGILLYGSVARGEATEVSDIDVLVVCAEGSVAAREAPVQVAAEMMAKHDTLVAVLDGSPAEYERLRRFPFGWQIAKEAVEL